jgi:hypothetical protein
MIELSERTLRHSKLRSVGSDARQSHRGGEHNKSPDHFHPFDKLNFVCRTGGYHAQITEACQWQDRSGCSEVSNGRNTIVAVGLICRRASVP